jgi:hypothetical protein
MKKSLLISAVLLAVSFSAAANQEPPTLKRPPRKAVISANKQSALLSAENTGIVIDAKASPAVRFAAAQLQEFLSQILGKKIAISAQAGKSTISMWGTPPLF